MRTGVATRIERMRRVAIASLAASGVIAFGLMAAVTAANAFSAATVYRNTSASVVLIFGFSDGGAGSSGTGSILTADGLILTNNHVVADAQSNKLFPNLVVYFKPTPISGDNRKDLTTPFLVDVVARDPELDLALLRVKNAPPGLRPLEVADSEEVDIGEPVAAIGHPGGGGLWTLTTGTISSKRRDKARDIFQTDTAINPGNSGGPLIDEHSRLVGVNTFVRRVNDQGMPLEGLNYSLRSSLALDWVNRQGVTRVSAVSRTSMPVAESAPTPRVTKPAPEAAMPEAAMPEAAPTQEPAKPSVPAPSPESTPKPSASKPMPEPGTEVDPAPAPRVSPRVTPSPDSSPSPEPREFEGPNGEKMYGVPNPTIDLDEALVEVRKDYQELIQRADDSVDEMNKMLEDYDNF